MSKLVCFYFQVHQPYRLRDLRAWDVGKEAPYFDTEKNCAIFRKVAEKCYLPANATILQLLKQHPDFRVSYSLSGVFLDQCREYGPDVLASFQELAKTGQVEFLAETYYHSLSALSSVPEFCAQVSMHVNAIKELFGQTATTFRNTELIYNNEIAQTVRLMGFQTILAEGADHLLHGRSPTAVYEPPHFRLSRKREREISRHRPLPKRSEDIAVLLKHYRLSDDVAFRFSNRDWPGYPLHADRFADWVAQTDGHTVNLFMDYETFGEHQWADTGIFAFLASLPRFFAERGMKAVTPSDAVASWRETNASSPVYDAHTTLSWADMERDLSAWQGNHIQRSSFTTIYNLEEAIKSTNDPQLLSDWRRLQTSDHLYYMCTKYWSDGDVHKYFSPYDSPYEAYRRFSHALADIRHRLDTHSAEADPIEKKHAASPTIRHS